MSSAEIRRGVLLTLVAGCVCPRPALAKLAAQSPPGIGSPKFFERLRAALAALGQIDDPHLRRLHAAVSESAARITFHEMSDDRATWSSDGDPDRGHTEPDDRRPKREGRAQPADGTIFVMMSAVQPGSHRWKSGLLVHELVHALDMSSGRYSPHNRVRERRAVFMQNIWRKREGFPLRANYHGQFITPDYQYAEKQRRIPEYVEYVFTRADFPALPPPG